MRCNSFCATAYNPLSMHVFRPSGHLVTSHLDDPYVIDVLTITSLDRIFPDNTVNSCSIRDRESYTVSVCAIIEIYPSDRTLKSVMRTFEGWRKQ